MADEISEESLERFNYQDFDWEPFIKDWEEEWRKANPGYPIIKPDFV